MLPWPRPPRSAAFLRCRALGGIIGYMKLFVVHTTTLHAEALGERARLRSIGVDAIVAPEDVPDGDFWQAAIPKLQRGCSANLVLVDAATERSPYALDEVSRAIQMQRVGRSPLLVVLFDGAAHPYGLSPFQTVQAQRGDPMSYSDRVVAWVQLNVSARQVAAAPVVDGNPRVGEIQAYPRGPIVPAHLTTLALARGIAAIVDPHLASALVNEANGLRRSADPMELRPVEIELTQLPHPFPPVHYWLSVLGLARVQGPRMMASLLHVIPYWQLPPEAAADRSRLLIDMLPPEKSRENGGA